MDRRRMTAIGVLVAAAGLTAAVTVPSFAGEEPRRAAPAADGVAPEVLDAMGRDLALTRDQAVKRLRTERWAAVRPRRPGAERKGSRPVARRLFGLRSPRRRRNAHTGPGHADFVKAERAHR
nr:hypothetical protein [Micromonospora provocatoris]